MKLLIWEYATGGGLLDEAVADLGALSAEGRAMVEAVAADAAAVQGTQVHLIWDDRLRPPHRNVGCHTIVHRVACPAQRDDVFQRGCETCEGVFVIAPETEGILAAWTDRACQGRARVLSASGPLLVLASDKWETRRFLIERGVPVPPGTAASGQERARWLAAERRRVALPAATGWITKPRDGCGSIGLKRWALEENPSLERGEYLERWIPGHAASVLAVGTPDGYHLLPPARQHLDPQSLTYRGGHVPLSQPDLRKRAKRLAERLFDVLPRSCGFVGVDLVLAATGAHDDVVIEVNPRLTTSYVGLRCLSRTNLMEALLGAADGRCPAWSFREAGLTFRVEGPGASWDS